MKTPTRGSKEKTILHVNRRPQNDEPCEHYIEPNFCGAKDGITEEDIHETRYPNVQEVGE